MSKTFKCDVPQGNTPEFRRWLIGKFGYDVMLRACIESICHPMQFTEDDLQLKFDFTQDKIRNGYTEAPKPMPGRIYLTSREFDCSNIERMENVELVFLDKPPVPSPAEFLRRLGRED